MAASSSCFCGVDPSPCKYDVFISFRGGDTRHNFTGHLYSALCRNRVKTYIDEISLEKGDDISRALPTAIEESAISIIIFSTNYASSSWCLDELLHILKCKRDKSQIVLPIFLGVDPSDIRKQKRSYADAFVQHEQRFYNTIDKVQEWRKALKEASGLSGWDSTGKSEHVIVDEVVKHIEEKLKYIRSNGGIEDLLKNLKEELRLANRVLEDAEEKQLTDEDVREWLFNLKEVNYRADELMDKINYEELRRKLGGASESSTSFATFNKSVEDEITEMLRKLEKLDARKDKLGLKELPEKRVSQRSYGAPLVRKSEVYGRKDDTEAILKLLLSDETCGDEIPMVLPIVGMGGIGKTTLAQSVYYDPRVENHFQTKVWVTISTEFDIFNITKQIFEGVTSTKFKSKEFSQLQYDLIEALEGKKYLFVLDDVWNEDYVPWNDLRHPFESGKSGSKILITTRSANVASTMSKVEAQNLKGLSNENCWKIFIQHAFGNEDLLNADPDLQKIGKGIVRKCKGLPLAVKSVAALLRSIPSQDEWRKILENPIWDLKLPENARKVLPALWLSYRHLSPQLKRCFAYCSIFPKDHRFNKEHLILLWMGEGLLEARGGTRMKDVGEEYFEILTSRSFFQPLVHLYKSPFIMHDLVHDLATFVLGDFGFRLEENMNLHNLPSKTRHLSFVNADIQSKEQFDGISNAKCLRTFLSMGYHDIDDLLVMEEGCLRVLSLNDFEIAELPDSIGSLKHLRYLNVSYSLIEELPNTICTLYNLETLLLEGCEKLTRLPTDIGNLKHLRHLDASFTTFEEILDTICILYNLETLLFEGCGELTRLPTDIGNLTHLRYLDVSNTLIEELPNTICTLYNLETLLLKECKELTLLPTDIGNLTHLRRLDASSTSIEEIPDTICTLYNLETLLLKECKELTLLPTDIGNLNHLRHLDVSSTSIEEIPDTICTLYNLETLLLKECKELTLLPTDIGNLNHLRHLDVSSTSIEEIPDTICTLYNLETLLLKECKELTLLPTDIGNLNHLRHLDVSSTSIEEIPDTICTLYNLETLLLKECKELTLLPTDIGNLNHLRHLDVSSTSIEEIPDTICTLYNLETLLLTRCRHLTRLPTNIGNLKHLRHLDVSSTSIEEIPDTICTLYNLETLFLMGCRHLTWLPTNIGCLKLRRLNFSGSSIEELPLHILNMKDSQTLPPLFILGKERADYTIKDLVCFQNLHGEVRIQRLENLVGAKLGDKKFITELGLRWDGDSDDSMKEREILDQLQPHTNLTKVYIEGYPGTRFSDWMGDQSFSSIVQVDLIRCENCRFLWPLDQLPSLKTLLIKESFSRVETINWEFFSNSSSMTNPFRSLQVLQFKKMAWWKEWLFREGEVVFPTLKELRLIKCPKLQVRLLLDCFPSLTRLDVRECRQVMPFVIPATHQGLIFPPLQELVLDGGLTCSFLLVREHADSTIKALGCFPNLHGELRIQGLENLVDVKNVCKAKLGDKKFITELGLLWDGDSGDSMKGREILDQLQPHTNLKKLYIEGYPGTWFSDWMGDQSFSSIVQVDLIRSKNCRSLWPLDQLPSLRTLLIEESFRGVETINWEFLKPFRSLQVLQFKNMAGWKEWLFREGEVVFPNLKKLPLLKCPELEVRLLPNYFPSLTKLVVEQCRRVMLFLIPSTNQGLIFPSLRELVIRECPEEELILEGGLPSNLERITISGCHNLKALDNNGFRLLASLQKLEIAFCEELQCLPELPSYPFDLVIRWCPLLYSRCQENGEDWHKIKHTRYQLSVRYFHELLSHQTVLNCGRQPL